MLRLNHLDLNKNELRNARIQNLASAPSSPAAGQVYYDTVLNQFGTYNGSTWTYLGTAPDLSNYVQKTGNETIAGIKTFSSFPVTPSSAPTTDYQSANKKYVDDTVSAAGGFTAEDAQDAVGTILTDSSSVNFTYDDALNTITASVINDSHTHTAGNVSGLATVATSGSYNDLIDQPTFSTDMIENAEGFAQIVSDANFGDGVLFVGRQTAGTPTTADATIAAPSGLNISSNAGIDGTGAWASNVTLNHAGIALDAAYSTSQQITLMTGVGGNIKLNADAVEFNDMVSGGVTQLITSNTTGTNVLTLPAATGTLALTGHTHTAANISDFDTEVSNNTDVAANTAARHTHANSAVLNATTASFLTADETKLDGIATGATANSSDAVLLARANHTGTQTASTISDFSTAADARISAAAGVSVASLTAGKIPTSQIPALALVDVNVVASQAAQLALTAQEGDVAVRSDLSKSFIHNGGVAGTMADWTELQTPTDVVTSVAGQTGVVVLAKGDVGLGNVDNTSDANKPVSTAQATADGLRLLKSSNLSDVANAATAFGNIKQAASDTATGVVELATAAEAQAKTDTTRALTAASVADFARKYTGTIGNGSLTSIAVTHGLGSQYVTAQVFDATSNAQVECDIVLTNATTTTFTFATAPTSNQYRVVIVG